VSDINIIISIFQLSIQSKDGAVEIIMVCWWSLDLFLHYI